MPDNTEKIKACTQWDDSNIKGWFGEYRFLSNFHICSIPHNGMIFASTESAYMAAKTERIVDKLMFTNILPIEAKSLGMKVPLKANWESIKLQVMYDVNLTKYLQHSDLREKLLATGDKYLEETNWWNDQYWGVCNGKGENMLGKTLMKVREAIKEYYDR